MNRIVKVIVAALMCASAVAHAGFSADEDALEPVVPQKRVDVAKEQKEAVKEVAQPLKSSDAVRVEVKPVEAPAPVAAPAQIWVARSGSTLRKTIEEWGRVADWEVVWESKDLDFPNPAQRTFSGPLEKVVVELFAPYKQAKRVPLVDGYRENRVIHVTEKR